MPPKLAYRSRRLEGRDAAGTSVTPTYAVVTSTPDLTAAGTTLGSHEARLLAELLPGHRVLDEEIVHLQVRLHEVGVCPHRR